MKGTDENRLLKGQQQIVCAELKEVLQNCLFPERKPVTSALAQLLLFTILRNQQEQRLLL